MPRKDQEKVKRIRIHNKFVYPKDLYPSATQNEDEYKHIKHKRTKYKKDEHLYRYRDSSTNELEPSSQILSNDKTRSNNHFTTRRKSLFHSNSFLDLKNFDLGGSHFDAGPSIYLNEQRQKLKKQEQREKQEKLQEQNLSQQKKLKSKKSSQKLKSSIKKEQYQKTEYSSSDFDAYLSPLGTVASFQQLLTDSREKFGSDESKYQTATETSKIAKSLKSKQLNAPFSLPLFEVLPIVKATSNAELIYQNSYILDGIDYEYNFKNKIDGIRPQLNLDYKKLRKSINLQAKPTDRDIVFGDAKIILIKPQDLDKSRLGWLRKLELKQNLPRKNIENWYDDEENLIENCCFPFFKDIFKLNRK